MPKEVAGLAKNLNIPLKELFSTKLAVDWWEGFENIGDIFLLAPAIVGSNPGEEYPADPRGKCIFLADGECEIHNKGKPFECAEQIHTETREIQEDRHYKVAKAWLNHQNIIVELLGREPEAEEYEDSLFGGLFKQW